MALSYQNYTGNNSTDTFSIPFTYTATSEISVTVDGVAETGLTFPSSSQVQLTSAPASGTVVQVRRTTNLASRAIDFASGSVLTEEDLDNSNIQIFHASQESVDLTDDTIQEDVDSKWDAESKVIKNVANPTNAQDAATKDYLENTWLTTADKAQLNSLNTTNLNTVAGSIANVNAVAGDATDIGTVSANIASVNTVATNIADVVTVANDLNEAISEIETAANDLNEAVSEIDTVSNAIANVNTVGLAIANVNTVSGAIANVNTTATNINNVNTVAGVSGNVTTVAGIASNVTAVAGDATDIGIVATNIADINTVAANNSDIDTVAGISANVTTVAGIAANVTSVAGNATNITNVAGNATNINTVAGIAANVTSVAGNATNINSVVSNETNINAAVSNATNINSAVSNATNINTVAGGIANVNTVATNLASVNNFADVYRIDSSAPTTSLDVGDLYFDTTSDILKVYGASGWQSAGSSVNGTSQRYHYDIGGAVTSVTGSDANGNTLAYDAGYVDVYVNGVRMSTADVTVTSGDTVTFAEALASGDEVDIVAYGTFSVASLNADNLDSGTVPTARVAGAYTGITSVGTLGSLNVGNINSTGTIVASSVGSQGARIERNGTTGGANIDSVLASGSIHFRTGTTERLRITSAGSVGIGNSSPTGKLDIVGGSTYQPHLRITNSAGGGRTYGINVGVAALSNGYFSIKDETADAYRMVITDSGNVGIGTSSPSDKLTVTGGSINLPTVNTFIKGGGHNVVQVDSTKTYLYGGTGGIQLRTADNASGLISFDNAGNVSSEVTHTFSLYGGYGTGGSASYVTYSFVGDPNTGMFSGAADTLKFATGGSERMRVNSLGNVGIGDTSNIAKLMVQSNFSSYTGVNVKNNNSNNSGVFINFMNSSGGNAGEIQQTGATTVNYSTTSDYRLKENVVTDWDATTRLKQLKPSRFNFITEADTTVDGFLAHEVQEIVPEAIHGTKDALDANGNAVMQSIDHSKLVPLLVKTIQELEARITALENGE